MFRLVGCKALHLISHTTEMATTLLRSHPHLLTTVSKTTASVEENDTNREYLEEARDLLDRFPVEVQHAVTKLKLEDAERMRTSLYGTAKALTRDNVTLATDLAASQQKAETLAQENKSLRLLLADGADGEERAALAKGAKAANAAELKIEGESGEGVLLFCIVFLFLLFTFSFLGGNPGGKGPGQGVHFQEGGGAGRSWRESGERERVGGSLACSEWESALVFGAC